MAKRSLCNCHKSHCFPHLSGVRPTPQWTEKKSLFASDDVLDCKKTKDDWCTNNLQTNALTKRILTYLSRMPNQARTWGWFTHGEESAILWEKITCPPLPNDWRRFINADAVGSDMKWWAVYWCHNQVDGLISGCTSSRWFINSPAGEPVE